MEAVDAAGERFFGRPAAGGVATEDLGDVAESLNAIDDGGFVKRVGGEKPSAALDVVVDGEETDGFGFGAGTFCGAGEASLGDAERAETVPVARASGTGDYVVDGAHDGVDGVDVGGVSGRDAGGEGWGRAEEFGIGSEPAAERPGKRWQAKVRGGVEVSSASSNRKRKDGDIQRRKCDTSHRIKERPMLRRMEVTIGK